MAFKLPKYTELTNDQKIIAGLGFDKNILVSAAPGTGKTVIAIYRAHELSDAGKKVAMLVYKRTLMKYLESTVKSLDIKTVVNTWHSWLVEFYDVYLITYLFSNHNLHNRPQKKVHFFQQAFHQNHSEYIRH